MLALVLPTTCPVCRRPGAAPCAACEDELRPGPSMTVPPGVDAVHAVLAYEDAGRELVARLKYRNARSTVAWLADRMAALATAGGVAARPVGPVCVTWVPTSATRRRERGFDQAEVLARAVARRLRLPCRRLLTRRPGPAQTGRSQSERRAGPPLTAAARANAPPTVILVDDVVTSGSTVRVAAAALRGAGARRVMVVAAARTPYHVRERARHPPTGLGLR